MRVAIGMLVLSMVSAVAWAATAPVMSDSPTTLLGLAMEWGIVGPFVAGGVWLIRYLLRKNDELSKALLGVSERSVKAMEGVSSSTEALTEELRRRSCLAGRDKEIG